MDPDFEVLVPGFGLVDGNLTSEERAKLGLRDDYTSFVRFLVPRSRKFPRKRCATVRSILVEALRHAAADFGALAHGDYSSAWVRDLALECSGDLMELATGGRQPASGEVPSARPSTVLLDLSVCSILGEAVADALEAGDARSADRARRLVFKVELLRNWIANEMNPTSARSSADA